ncbi:MAG TPA: glycoside hydrolase family 3 C-terminal domain-containing protein [Bacteroidales bacterium]|nr:glycoside hydrolase family 3 C-terminal domain-containing protein [Bacteroidales bacterium]HOQ97052.1 glycoside hydrolase family 3 C-terminal domain-containing protein [Bacteroidales bacterium]HPL85019.1 glycoside hydrolase family 3 C-terminal domain-containing protein [Bacteroidales bacterium]
MKKILIITGICMLAACSADTEKQIQDLTAQMTLEEKVDMLHGQTMFTSAGVERLGIAPVKYADGPFGIREELEPHSWRPLGLTTDSATFFPTGSALAATWSEEMAYLYGKGMAEEARTRGKDMILGPAINIQRIPTGGRTYEYFSEDPLLSSRLAVGYVRGVQDNGAAACIKHYAMNNQENNRGMVDVIVSDRAMREIYLPPFRAAVEEAGALGVMSAYNKVNGTWCAENEILLDKILRQEWGFRGMVISDWYGTHSTVQAALAGLDVEMPGNMFFGQALLDSVRNGAIPEEIIDRKVGNILRVRLAIDPVEETSHVNPVSTPEHGQMVYKIASRSIVLLKNEGSLLPLDLEKTPTIAVIGDNAIQKHATGGIGAGVKTRYEVTPLEALEQKIGDRATLVYARGYKGFSRQDRERGGILGGVVLSGAGGMLTGSAAPGTGLDQEMLAQALEAAAGADMVLFFAGNNREVETEGADRMNIILPSLQDQLIREIATVNPNIVTVVVTGAPVDLSTVEPCSKAMLVSWFNGSEAGNALADVLLGTVVPSGKLPFTFPVRLEDSPAYALKTYPNFDKAPYSEDIYVGYRWFDAWKIEPLFPFGHGLSYTTFTYDSPRTGKETYRTSDVMTVSFRLSNTGKYPAREVVQLYVHRPGSNVEFPENELKAFKDVQLEPGKSAQVTLKVPASSLMYWNTSKGNWTLEPGTVELRIGSSSRDIRLKKSITLRGSN